jgi:hypothetical protein
LGAQQGVASPVLRLVFEYSPAAATQAVEDACKIRQPAASMHRCRQKLPVATEESLKNLPVIGS